MDERMENIFIRTMLSHQCPVHEEGGVYTFAFELHCDGQVEVEANKDQYGSWNLLKVNFVTA
jgi:hypothetical protein